MPALGMIIDAERTPFRAVTELSRQHPGATMEELVERGAVVHLAEDATLEVGVMPAGAPSVMFCFGMPDGRVVLAESSLKLLLTATDTFRSVHGEPREGMEHGGMN